MSEFLSMTKEQVESLPEAKAAEVLAAWVKAKRTELPTALAGSSLKPIARLAKKAIYQLSSVGVAVEVEKPKGEQPSLESAPMEFEGVLSQQLGSGERAFLAALPVRGGLELFTGIVHDELGIAHFGSERSNRSKWRKHLASLEKAGETRNMIVDFARLRLELGRALAITRRNGTDLDTEIENALQRLGIVEENPDVAIPALESGDEAGAADGAALHSMFELTQWLPSEKDLQTLAVRVDALKVLPIPDEAKEAKRLTFARELAAEAFTPEARTLYARRLLYTAELVEFLKRPDEAKRLRAEARRLAHTTATSTFAEQLFVKSLANLPKTLATQLGLKKD